MPFLGSRLKPIVLDEKQVGRWIAELDSDQFDTREAALQELARRGALVEPAVQNALKDNVSLETRRRLEQLLKTLQAAPLLVELRVLRGAGAGADRHPRSADGARNARQGGGEGMADARGAGVAGAIGQAGGGAVSNGEPGA